MAEMRTGHGEAMAEMRKIEPKNIDLKCTL
jgi:hypothetical protein